MADISRRRAALIARILEGDGRLPAAVRRAAFDHRDLPEPLRPLVEKIARNAWKVTDEDVAAVKAAGFSEDAVFELTVSTAVGQASRQYENALAALEAATATTSDTVKEG